MAKYFGAIGFDCATESDPVNHPGVWTPNIVERNYYGDIVRNQRGLRDSSEHVNDDISINNSFSILADPFATDHMYAMRYLTYCGTKWKVTNVEVQYPRLILSVGGVYNDH